MIVWGHRGVFLIFTKHKFRKYSPLTLLFAVMVVFLMAFLVFSVA